MATPRLFANATSGPGNPSNDTGTTLNQGFANDGGNFPEWIAYQTATNVPITESNGYVYVAGPDESSQTFYVAIAMSTTDGGGGTPPDIGWPDIAFYGCLTGDSDPTKIAVINQACVQLNSYAVLQGNVDMQDNLSGAGFPFASGGSSGNFARQLNGDAGAGSAGTAGKKLPLVVFENGALL